MKIDHILTVLVTCKNTDFWNRNHILMIYWVVTAEILSDDLQIKMSLVIMTCPKRTPTLLTKTNSIKEGLLVTNTIIFKSLTFPH